VTENGNQVDNSEGREASNLATAVLATVLLAIIALFGFAAVLFFLWLILRT
jgi:hypothetical protein